MIDSPAHYNNGADKKPFRNLTQKAGSYALAEGDRDPLFVALLDADIPHSIEPGVSLQSCKEVLALAEGYPGRIFPTMGVPPTR